MSVQTSRNPPSRNVAIIGRPNVGKSTLFNRLVGKRLALVDDRPGVTRDRREGEANLLGLTFRVIDTAGFEEDHAETLPGRMRLQTEAAMRMADVALLVMDARAGVVPLDAEIARWLRGGSVPVILVANKVEGRSGADGVMEAYALGFGEPVAISAEHGEGMADLFQALLPHIEPPEAESAPVHGVPDPVMLKAMPVPRGGESVGVAADGQDRDESEGEGAEFPEPDLHAPLQLAIVGRPNAGKSTLVNRMIGEDRMITGPEAGLTRDAITIDWSWEGRPVRLIDTAGLRRRAKVSDKLEKLSAMDTQRAIDFAEVVVLLLDATRGLEAQDLRIADQIFEEGRAMVIVLNKWDAAMDGSRLFNGVRAALEEGFSQARGVPLLTVSALTGKGIDTIMKVAFEVRAAWSSRIGTGTLNRWFEKAVAANPPPAPGGKRIKLRYITQNGVRPPSFVVFGGRVDELPESYRRYLVNGIRRDLGFGAVPVRLALRSPRNPFAPES